MISQVDPRWKNNRIGNSNVTIGQDGCLISCISYLIGTTPDEIAKHNEYFDANGILVDYAKLASDFGASCDPRRDVALHDSVVCQTSFDGYLHFVIRENGQILDPLSLDGHPLRNYVIKGYRNIWKENMHYPNKTIEDLDNDLFLTNEAFLKAKKDLEITDKLRIQGLETIKNLKDQMSQSDAQKKLDQIKQIIG